MKRNSILIVMLLLTFVLSSCGDLFTNDTEKDKRTSVSRFSASCELKVDAFADMFTRDIEPEIECLRENLMMFIDIVKYKKKGYLSKKKLETFIKKYATVDFDPATMDIVDGVFDIVYLLKGGDKGIVHKDEVNELIDLLIYFNKHILLVYRFFDEDRTNSLSDHNLKARKVYEFTNRVKREVKLAFKNKGSRSISINKLMKRFFGNGDQDIYRKVKTMLFLKKAFIGGNVKRLNVDEFSNLLQRLPSLVRLAFDMSRASKIEKDQNQSALVQLFKNDIIELRNALYTDPDPREYVFKMDDVLNVVQEFLDLGDFDVSKYKDDELLKLKALFFRTDESYFTASEVKVALDHAYRILDKGHVFYRIYNDPSYSAVLEDSRPFCKKGFTYNCIKEDFEGWHAGNSAEDLYRKDFARIVANYRFMKGSFTSPFYSYEIQRNPNAIFEIGVFEYLGTIIFQKYGHSVDTVGRGGYAMTLDGYDQGAELGDDKIDIGLNDTIKDYIRILEDLGIALPGRINGNEHKNIANNVMLMSTLFVYQANGGAKGADYLEIPELVDFLTSIFTGIELQKFFSDEMWEMCDTPEDRWCNDVDPNDPTKLSKTCNRIQRSCFRKNFLNVFDRPIPNTGITLKDYMPLMYEYLETLYEDNSSDSMNYFFDQAEGFTRTCTHLDEAETEESPLSKGDVLSVFAGLLNVEATMLKYDQKYYWGGNENNIMDYAEVMTAYDNVFQDAIKGMIRGEVAFLPEWGVNLISKPIFKYLIKYESLPDFSKFKGIWSLIKWVFRFNKKSDADRATVSAVLKIIGDMEGKDNPFACCLFRDLDTPGYTCSWAGQTMERKF